MNGNAIFFWNLNKLFEIMLVEKDKFLLCSYENMWTGRLSFHCAFTWYMHVTTVDSLNIENLWHVDEIIVIFVNGDSLNKKRWFLECTSVNLLTFV